MAETKSQRGRLQQPSNPRSRAGALSASLVPFSSDAIFVRDVVNSEDLAPIPRTTFLIASGLVGPGHSRGRLYLVDTLERTAEEAFPAAAQYEPDEAYGEVEQPDVSTFSAHGLALREGVGDVHTLYVVNHGGRESVEVFRVDASRDRPRLSWLGAVIQAPGVVGNAVTALPDGGIAITKIRDSRDPEAYSKTYAGEVTGNVKEWHPATGWKDVPGSEMCAPNGVEVSPDGRWYFINAWAVGTLVRLTRGATPWVRDLVALPLLPDNVKWTPQGLLLVAGQTGASPKKIHDALRDRDVCNFPVAVVSIDPESLEVGSVLEYEHEEFGAAGTAILVGGDLWVSSCRSDRIACFEAKESSGR